MLTSIEAVFLVPQKGTARANLPSGSPPGHVRSANESTYCFGGEPAAEAAEFAASAAALAAAAESAAAEAAASGAAAGGGVESAAGAGGASVLAQALSTNAATKALNASLVFIVSIPQKIFMDKTLGKRVVLGFPPKMHGTGDFRGFRPNFISLSFPSDACRRAPTAARGSGAYFSQPAIRSPRARRQSRSALFPAFADPDEACGSGARGQRF